MAIDNEMDTKTFRRFVNKSHHQRSLLSQIVNVLEIQYPFPVEEYKFHKARQWRFDLAWPDLMIAVEVQGGNWIKGRHTNPASLEKEYEKLCQAAIDGWRVLLVTPTMIEDGTAIQSVLAILGVEQGG